MYWHFEDQKPLYKQLVEQMRHIIAAGVWPRDSRLPSVRLLAGETGLNPSTVQRALAELEEDGLAYSVGTEGRYVTNNADHLELLRKALILQHTQNYRAQMEQLGCSESEMQRALHYSNRQPA